MKAIAAAVAKNPKEYIEYYAAAAKVIKEMAVVQEAEAAKKAVEAAAKKAEEPATDATVSAATEAATAAAPETTTESHPSEVIPAASEETH